MRLEDVNKTSVGSGFRAPASQIWQKTGVGAGPGFGIKVGVSPVIEQPGGSVAHRLYHMSAVMDQLAEYGNVMLTWIGFGTLVGLAAKAVMPGRDPGGTVANLMMGIAGTLIGCAILRYFYPTQNIQPISLEGFSVGAGGAFVLLLFYKVLGGYWFTEGERMSQRHFFSRSTRRRSFRKPILDE